MQIFISINFCINQKMIFFYKKWVIIYLTIHIIKNQAVFLYLSKELKKDSKSSFI